jgi:hypothetical protein
MAKQPAPHPILSTRRLRQFLAEDADSMHQCFANCEAMRFWNHPVNTKRISVGSTNPHQIAHTATFVPERHVGLTHPGSVRASTPTRSFGPQLHKEAVPLLSSHLQAVAGKVA